MPPVLSYRSILARPASYATRKNAYSEAFLINHYHHFTTTAIIIITTPTTTIIITTTATTTTNITKASGTKALSHIFHSLCTYQRNMRLQCVGDIATRCREGTQGLVWVSAIA